MDFDKTKEWLSNFRKEIEKEEVMQRETAKHYPAELWETTRKAFEDPQEFFSATPNKDFREMQTRVVEKRIEEGKELPSFGRYFAEELLFTMAQPGQALTKMGTEFVKFLPETLAKAGKQTYDSSLEGYEKLTGKPTDWHEAAEWNLPLLGKVTNFGQDTQRRTETFQDMGANEDYAKKMAQVWTSADILLRAADLTGKGSALIKKVTKYDDGAQAAMTQLGLTDDTLTVQNLDDAFQTTMKEAGKKGDVAGQRKALESVVYLLRKYGEADSKGNLAALSNPRLSKRAKAIQKIALHLSEYDIFGRDVVSPIAQTKTALPGTVEQSGVNIGRMRMNLGLSIKRIKSVGKLSPEETQNIVKSAVPKSLPDLASKNSKAVPRVTASLASKFIENGVSSKVADRAANTIVNTLSLTGFGKAESVPEELRGDLNTDDIEDLMQTQYEVLTRVENSIAGFKKGDEVFNPATGMTETGEGTIYSPSSFPDFLVGKEVRTTPTVNSAITHIKDGTTPPEHHNNILDAYNQIQDEISRRSGMTRESLDSMDMNRVVDEMYADEFGTGDVKKIQDRESVDDFVNELTPDDVGTNKVGNNVVEFEGCTDACWADYRERGLTMKEYEDEMLGGFKDRHDVEPTEVGWQRGGVENEPDVFYAVFSEQTAKGTQPTTLYRGEGGGEIGLARPEIGNILGDATYLAHTSEDAAKFGQDISEFETSLSNPLVINNDVDFAEISLEAGNDTGNVLSPNAEKTKENIKRVRDYIESEGYDGVVVNNVKDNNVLSKMFEVDQTIAFDKDSVTKQVKEPEKVQKRFPEIKRELNDAIAKNNAEEAEKALKEFADVFEAVRVEGDAGDGKPPTDVEKAIGMGDEDGGKKLQELLTKTGQEISPEIKDHIKTLADRYLISGKDVLRKMGRYGSTLADMFNEVEALSRIQAGEMVGDMKFDTPLEDLTKEEQWSFWALAEDLDTVPVMNEKVKQVAEMWDEHRKLIGKTAADWGVMVRDSKGNVYSFQPRENYAPHLIKIDKLIDDPEYAQEVLEGHVAIGNFDNMQDAQEYLDGFRNLYTGEGSVNKFYQKIAKDNDISIAKAEHLARRYILPNTPQKFGNLEKTRGLNVKLYDLDVSRSLPSFYGNVWRRLYEIKNYGRSDEVARGLITLMGHDGYDWGLANKIFDVEHNRIPIDSKLKDTFRFITEAQVVKLAHSAVSQFGQQANIFGYAHPKNWAKGVRDLAQKEYTKEDMIRAATILDEITYKFGEDVQKTGWAEQFLESTRFKDADNIQRMVASSAAKHLVNDLLANPYSRESRDKLKDLLIKDKRVKKLLDRGYATEKDLKIATFRLSKITQGTFSPSDLPVGWRDNQLARTMTLFGRFAYHQARFAGKKIAKYPKTILPYLFMSGLMGEIILDIKSLMLNRERKKLTDPKRHIANLKYGSFGLLSDMIDSIIYTGGLARQFVGPVGDDISRTATSLYYGAESVRKGEPKPKHAKELFDVSLPYIMRSKMSPKGAAGAAIIYKILDNYIDFEGGGSSGAKISN